MQTREWEIEVERFLRAYVEAFLSIDGARIGGMYNAPCLTVRADGSIHAFQTRGELQSFFQGLADTYSRAGAKKWKYTNLSIEPLGSRSAVATLDWEMQREDASIIRGWRQTYNFILADGRARILASTFHLS